MDLMFWWDMDMESGLTKYASHDAALKKQETRALTGDTSPLSHLSLILKACAESISIELHRMIDNDGLSFLPQVALTLAVIVSTLFTLVLVTLPSRYIPSEHRSLDTRKPGDEHANQGRQSSTSVVVFVLGDIGRSPRMQYHALSIARYGGTVDLVGYDDSPLLPDIQTHKLINNIPLKRLPAAIQSSNRALFPLIAPLKVVFQAWSIYHALGYGSSARKFMLMQNPPSIPTLLIAIVISFLRGTKLIVDWHNLGHTLLALKLGERHMLVRASEIHDKILARHAFGHLTVSRAMARWLGQHYRITPQVLHDRPAGQFQVLSSEQREEFLQRLPETESVAQEIVSGRRKLLVSSTSWTPDEDFSILLDALVAYSAAAEEQKQKIPPVTVIITGKGPLKDMYLQRVAILNKESKLARVDIKTAWLSIEDYALLLGAADLGVSLHTSSSGLDLPMKVVDMFGAGLPVVGWDDFEAWDELVQEGVNGRGFKSAAGLAQLLEGLLGTGGNELERLRQGAHKESSRRWDDEWRGIAGVFGIDVGA